MNNIMGRVSELYSCELREKRKEERYRKGYGLKFSLSLNFSFGFYMYLQLLFKLLNNHDNLFPTVHMNLVQTHVIWNE